MGVYEGQSLRLADEDALIESTEGLIDRIGVWSVVFVVKSS